MAQGHLTIWGLPRPPPPLDAGVSGCSSSGSDVPRQICQGHPGKARMCYCHLGAHLLPSRALKAPQPRQCHFGEGRCRCPENAPDASPRGRPIRLGETPSNAHLAAPKREVWSSREDTDVAEAQAGTAPRNKGVTRPRPTRRTAGHHAPGQWLCSSTVGDRADVQPLASG